MHLHQIDHSTGQFLATEIFRNGTWYRISWEMGRLDRQWTMRIWELPEKKIKNSILRLNKYILSPNSQTSIDYINEICC